MHVERIGFTPVKGSRHLTHDLAELTADGLIGDRVFCLVDRSRSRVLRTVENPALLQACARWEAGVLSVELAGNRVEGVPSGSGEMLTVDYWGRAATLEVCTGPWARTYSEHLGQDVSLCRCAAPGEVVYGASVSLVTTSSMHLLAQRLGREVGSERFRATFLVDTVDTQYAGGSTSHLEDSWLGRELRVGEAIIRVRSSVPRCAVVNLDPVTGSSDAPVLGQLATYRHDQSSSEVSFGVDAVVTRPGRVGTGDQVELEP